MAAVSAGSPTSSAIRPRVIVTTDGEQDDLASMHRFILYTNEFDVAGIIETSSRFHYAGDASAVPPIPQVTWLGSDWIHAILRNYATAYPNLKANSPTYPTPESLASVVKVGNISYIGEYAKNTEGSEWIKKVLLDDDPRPVYISVWGGTNVVAAALRSIRDEHYGTAGWQDVYAKVSRKTWILIDLDQDATYKDYIAKFWPDVNIVMNNSQFGAFAYRWNAVVPETLKPYYQAKFQDTMIRKGPIEADYSLANGERGSTAHDWFSEGDTPQFMQQFPIGLSDLTDYNPSYGNWGGRYEQKGPHLWVDNPPYLNLAGPRTRDYSPYTNAGDFPSTTVTEGAAAGAKRIRVASVANLGPRDVVTIGSGANAQQNEILSVGGAPATPTELAVAATAGATNIKVKGTSGFVVGDPITIAADAENYDRIVTGVGSAAIETTLAGDLPQGATKAQVGKTGFGIGEPIIIGAGDAAQTVRITAVGSASSDHMAASAATTLAAGSTTLSDATAAGAREIRLESVAGFLKDQLVGIGAGNAADIVRLGAVGVGGGSILGLPSVAGGRTAKIHSTANFLAGTPVWIDRGADLERAVISTEGPRFPARGADQEGTRAAGAATLSVPSNPGARALKVTNVDGFLVGAPITVGSGDTAENVHVSFVGTEGPDGTGIELVEPLGMAHAIDSAVAASGLTFVAPLVRDHSIGTVVTASGASLADPLRRPHDAASSVSTITPAGSRTLKVMSVIGFEAGRRITIDDGARSEAAVIASVGTEGLGGTGLVLVSPTKLAHSGPVAITQAAAQAGATRIRLAAPPPARDPQPFPGPPALPGSRSMPPQTFPLAPIAVGDRITIGEGADAERVTVTSVGTGGLAGTGLAFTPALRRDHAGPVKVRDGGSGVTFAPAVRSAHRAGDPVFSPGGGLTIRPSLARSYDRGTIIRGSGAIVVLAQPLALAASATDVFRSNMSPYYPQTRWTAAIQNDFAARVDWQVKSYAEANHAPVVSTPANRITVAPGQVARLRGMARDPDGNGLKYKWWQYREPGTYPGAVTLSRADLPNAEFVMPQDAKPGHTIHMIFEVEDTGKPPMTRYQRVIITAVNQTAQ